MYNHTEIIDFIKARFPNQDFIPLHEPRFVGNERAYVLDAIDSTFVSSVGAYVNRFEEMMTKVTGCKYAVATGNGTSALHICLLVIGVKPNDLVITQALTFIATCNAISYAQAQPVFVDVDKDTMGLSPEALESYLEEHTYYDAETKQRRTKLSKQRIAACMPMHTFGHPCRIDKIAAICENYHISLIEDAAESIGSTYNGVHTGSFGILGAFSFNGNKTVTCGGGGVMVTNNEHLAKLAKHLTTQAKVPHRWEFNHDMVGYNYRMPNLNAALACAQLENLEYFIANKRALADDYKKFFGNSKDVQFKIEIPEGKSNYWLNTIEFNDKVARDNFLTASNDSGVMTRPAWTPMHQLPMFKNCVNDGLKNTIRLGNTLVNIPSSVRV